MSGYRKLGEKKGYSESRGLYFSFMEKEMKIINWEQDFYVYHRIVSAVKIGEFVSNRMSIYF